ncbi:hypothetical protein AK812_SmicGene43412 [Symbiodinium microadriaticum]|uniref:CCHC-type domain-containing protein n=1 Tax=Symbiodinium microadriaticum TaxID=2951 RepID=A0A1Q9C135_SYMMI|nr:hypothetical protein AK812_SmicGene43412 [Symbiodinium microadriaticum]
MDRRDRDQVPSWDGEAAGWNTYVRRVRLHWERTAPKKRRLIGAELASRLTGRAWDVSGDLDHARLQQREGATYLLEYLEQRLGRSPIPDLGTRLEDFLVRLRRQPGARMIQWTTELRECYRRLQRALARARGAPRRLKDGSPKKADHSSPKSSAGASGLPIERRRSDTTAEPEPPADDEVHPGDREDEHPPVASERGERGAGGWTAAEWEAWWGGYQSPSRRRFGNSWRHEDSEEDDGPQPEWERFQLEEIDALPPEVLGWSLLRRAHLPSQARLSVLAATNNRLDIDLIEKGVRDQEEDLLQAEERRGPKRTYWVEQEGSWGLLLDEPPGEEGPGGIHWVGDRLPEEVYWSYADGDWWTEDPEGVWWNWSDAKPWFDVNEAMVVDPTVGKELQEALTLYQDKVRTFKESRQLVAARNTARGFYPLSGAKGKGKGKSKGKPSFGQKGGKGKGKKGTPPATSIGSSSAALAAEGPQRPGNAGYTGCFICGSKDHDFRRCPKRGSGKGAGSAHLIGDGSWTEAPTYMVQSVLEGGGAAEATETVSCYDQAFVVQPASREPEDTVEEPENQEPLCFMHVMDGNPADDASLGGLPVEAAMSVAGQLHPGYAVIDSGATETVGSLEAIEAVVSMRRSRYGMENVRVFSEAKRSFRFGNAQQETATSYVEVPQTLAGRPVSLGVFALDVPRIPILLSIRTLRKLGAEINFQRRTIVFQAVDPGVTVGLQESASGHLLLDLVHDWMRTPGASQSFSGTVLSQVLSGYKDPNFQNNPKGMIVAVLSLLCKFHAVFRVLTATMCMRVKLSMCRLMTHLMLCRVMFQSLIWPPLTRPLEN